MYCYISLVASLFVAASGEVLPVGQLAQTEDHGKVQKKVGKYSEVHYPTALSATSSHFTNTSDAVQLLDKIYHGHAAHAFWKVQGYTREQEVLKETGEPSKAFIYGEIAPPAFMQLLQHVGARAGQKYFDLGSGTGKTVFAAWLLGLDAAGVELVETRWSTACKTVLRSKGLGYKKKTKDGPGVSFVHGNFLKANFSGADIVFINSVMFSKAMMGQIANIARTMKPNSKIISTFGLAGSGLRYEEKVVGATSWSKATTWVVQTVIPGAPDPAAGLSRGAEVSEMWGGAEHPSRIAVSPSATLGAVEAPAAPASLIRQEPPRAAAPARHHEEYKRREGPLLGATTLPDDDLKLEPGANSCSMEVEEELETSAGKVLVEVSSRTNALD